MRKPKNENYTYSFENESFLDGILYRTVVPVVLNRLPMTLAPNKITVFSGFCALTAFVIMLQASIGHFYLWFLIPVLILLYLVSDCLDGGQARRTQMFSPLGEFLDHFFDSAVTGYLCGGILITYQEKDPLYFILILAIGYLTQAASFWERYKTRKMHFGKFSSTETVFILTGIITAGYFPSVRHFVMNPLIGNLSPLRIFILVSGFFALLNTVLTLIRAKGINLKFASYILSSVITGVLLCMTDFSLEVRVVFYFMYQMIYLAKLLVAITLDEKDGIPDFIFPVILLIVIFTKTPDASNSYAYIREALCFVYLIFFLNLIVINNMFTFIHKHVKEHLKEFIAKNKLKE